MAMAIDSPALLIFFGLVRPSSSSLPHPEFQNVSNVSTQAEKLGAAVVASASKCFPPPHFLLRKTWSSRPRSPPASPFPRKLGGLRVEMLPRLPGAIFPPFKLLHSQNCLRVSVRLFRLSKKKKNLKITTEAPTKSLCAHGNFVHRVTPIKWWFRHPSRECTMQCQM
jgi:hypothetical protein